MSKIDKVADNLEDLCNLFPKKQFYYAHKDGRVGFDCGQISWFTYNANVMGFVDAGHTDTPEMARLTKVPKKK